jgi:hypothetical protein
VKFAFVCQSAASLGQQFRAWTRSPRGSQRASQENPRGSAEQRQALMLAVEDRNPGEWFFLTVKLMVWNIAIVVAAFAYATVLFVGIIALARSI